MQWLKKAEKKPGSRLTLLSSQTYLLAPIEKVVIKLQRDLTENMILDMYQSGFFTGHSTDPALLKVSNDLLLTADSKACTIECYLSG